MGSNNKSSGSEENQNDESCVVIMPFKEPFDSYYATVIKPAVQSASLAPIRADSLFRSSPIMDDLWVMIQEAKVIVAELTDKNPNVFYELGLAHAIGKPIVLISESIEDVPFDLQSLRVVTYDKDDPSWGSTLKADIVASLEETLEDPEDAVPSIFRKEVKSQAPSQSEAMRRLDLLEREVRALRRQPGGWRSTRNINIESVNDLRLALDEGKVSLDEAAEIVKSAISSGIRPAHIKDELKRVSTEENFKKIMNRVDNGA